MRNPVKPMLICLLSLLSLLPVLAADLKTYSDVYQKNAEEIRQTFQPKFDDLQKQYQKSLETLKANAQSRGDFKTTQAAKTEIERFQKAKTLPPVTDENEIPEIQALQAAYVRHFTKLETEQTANLGALTVKYEQVLDRLLKELTKADKLDEAAAVAAEQSKAQTAVKGYSETMVTLTGLSATNAPPAATAGKSAAKKDLYLVLDLSSGTKAKAYPAKHLADVPKGGWADEYKTDKLVLRKIVPGTFTMGSPDDELGHKGNEKQHEVKLTQAFYIGVFEVTQKQWELVMGDRPSYFKKSYASRPVEQVNYNAIRGAGDGAAWPATSQVDGNSFMGRLRARTGKAFDLPTEAQWEYACRAGTKTALNSGKNLAAAEDDPNLADVGRYKFNGGDGATANTDPSGGTAKAGSFPPNSWGLYDMHGNVWDLCLDWLGNYSGAESDPKGALAGSARAGRGGCWRHSATFQRAAFRADILPDCYASDVGFRVVLPIDEK